MSGERAEARVEFALQQAPHPELIQHEAAYLIEQIWSYLGLASALKFAPDILQRFTLEPERLSDHLLLQLCDVLTPAQPFPSQSGQQVKAPKVPETERVMYRQLIGMILDAGYPADGRNKDGYTPLMLAAQAGDVPSLGLLLEHGADPDVVVRPELHPNFHLAFQDNRTALLEAVDSGQTEAVALLLDSGASVQPPFHNYLLFPAVKHADLAMLHFVLDKIPPEQHHLMVFNALLQASQGDGSKDPSPILPFLLSQGLDLNFHDELRLLPLEIYLQHKFYPAIKYALEAGADPQLLWGDRFISSNLSQIIERDPELQKLFPPHFGENR